MSRDVSHRCDNQIRLGRKYEKCNKPVDGDAPTLFSLDGTAFAGDLCAGCKQKLHEAMAPFMKISRPEYTLVEGVVRKALGLLPDGRAVTATGVREWAQANGVTVSSTGRIAQDVYAQYYAAHGVSQ